MTNSDAENEAPANPRLMRVPAAAAYLGVAKGTLDKWRIFGTGPAYSKLGRIITYDVADLDAFLASRRRTSTSEKKAA